MNLRRRYFEFYLKIRKLEETEIRISKGMRNMNYTNLREEAYTGSIYCPCKSRRLFAGGSNSPATGLLIVSKLLVRRIIEL